MKKGTFDRGSDLKKCIAVGIILLFIGVAVAPSINSSVVKTYSDNDLIEVTSQACGIQGFGNTTVKLTKEQYQNLEQYLVDFRARLNQTTTRGEAVPLFKDAVVELNKYGLLPKGMSVEKAQKLILKKYPMVSIFGSRFRSLDENLFCLVAGSILPIQVYGLFELFFFRTNIFLNLLLSLINFVNPISIGNAFGIGTLAIGDHYHSYNPSKGWVKSVGLYGYQQWNGSLYGQIANVERPFHYFFFSYQDFIGIWGFCGFKIDGIFFLGFAIAVGLDTEPPWFPPFL